MSLTLTVMTREQRDAEINKLMRYVPLPGHKLLRTVLAATPEALDMFANGYVQEAFAAVKQHAAAGHITLKHGLDLDHFLYMVTEAMPREYRTKHDD